MRYFLMVLAIVLASFGHTQTASAQACTGFALLKDGDQYVDMGGGRALVDNRCYQRALCIGGTISNLGGNLYGCFVVPPCEGNVSLKTGDQVTKNNDGNWNRSGDPRTYCEVSCPTGQNLEQVSAKTFECKAPAPTCSGVGDLKSGEQIWRRAANMWKTKDGRNTYCSVTCPSNHTLTHVSGDTHVCKKNAPTCNGVGNLKSGQEIWRRASNMWKTKDGRNVYCSVKCPANTTLTRTEGDTHICKPNPPKCSGTKTLSGDGVATKGADGFWRLQNGNSVYCAVNCPTGKNLTKVTGNSFQCKTPAPTCSGVGNLKSGQEIWRRASNMWKTKDGKNIYCSVKCPSGTKLTHVKGDTHVCKPTGPDCTITTILRDGEVVTKFSDKLWRFKANNKAVCNVTCNTGKNLTKISGNDYTCKAPAPTCNGVGNLKSGQEIWRRASNMWKTKDGKNIYCSVKCPANTTLTHVKGDTHICKPNPPKCSGTKTLSGGGVATKGADGFWRLQNGNSVYCAVDCPTGKNLKKVSGNSFQCKTPAPTCNGVGNLKSGREIWRRASNMWKTKDGKNIYCSVKCPANTTLTHVKGDTHICKPNAPTCEGTGLPKVDEKIWKKSSNQWTTQFGKKTFCKVQCPSGSTLTHVKGDEHVCKAKPKLVNCQALRDKYNVIPGSSWGSAPTNVRNTWSANKCDTKVTKVTCKYLSSHYGIVAGKTWGKAKTLDDVRAHWSKLKCAPAPTCKGVGNLKSGQEIWKKASNMWKTKDGKNTYCSVKCPGHHTLIHVSGDTHVCKKDAQPCSGVGNLKSGQEIWRRASNMWKTKDGKNVYCSVKCPANTALKRTDGDTHVCKPNAPKCVVGNLKENQEVLKRAAGIYKTKDLKNTYCGVKCPSGTKLTNIKSDVYACKAPAKVQKCEGEFKSVPGGLTKIANQGQTVTLKEAAWVFYGNDKCFNKGDFSKGKKLKCDNNVFGDPKSGVKNACYAMFKQKAPACKGEGSLKANDTIIRKASNMWKTKDGKNTYCSVKCASGSKLTKKSGDTYFCKAEQSSKVAGCKGKFTSLPGFVKRLADEGKNVTAPDNVWVFYGVKDCYNKKDFKKGARIRCNNKTFGDPIQGKRKTCFGYFK